MSGFTVIDNTTGHYPDCGKIALTEDWAKHLIYCDIDTFAINEDGNLILIDDCGNCAFCPADRFTVVFEKQIPKKPKIYNNIYPKDLYECPLCECGLRANARWKDTYCPNCGVKIDWGDTE